MTKPLWNGLSIIVHPLEILVTYSFVTRICVSNFITIQYHYCIQFYAWCVKHTDGKLSTFMHMCLMLFYPFHAVSYFEALVSHFLWIILYTILLSCWCCLSLIDLILSIVIWINAYQRKHIKTWPHQNNQGHQGFVNFVVGWRQFCVFLIGLKKTLWHQTIECVWGYIFQISNTSWRVFKSCIICI